MRNSIDEILGHEWFNDIDIELIRAQSFESPIYSIVTDEKVIMTLTEVSPEKYTQYWDNKEK